MQVYSVVILLICLYLNAYVLSDVVGSVPYQSTCNPSVNDGVCSTSQYCQCARLASGGNICTQNMNCDYAAECDANNSCPKENSTCVIDGRCPGKRLCYSIVIFSPELCPPLPADGN